MFRHGSSSKSPRWIIAVAFCMLSMSFAGCLGSDDVDSPDETAQDDHVEGEDHGNATANQTADNATNTNGTAGTGGAGNVTDTNGTTGNGTDTNTTTNQTTGPKLPDPITDRWVQKIGYQPKSGHKTGDWTFEGDEEDRINVTLRFTLSIENSEDYEAIATSVSVSVVHTTLDNSKINSGKSETVGGVRNLPSYDVNQEEPANSTVEPNVPEKGPVVVEFERTYRKAGTYTLSLDGRGVENSAIVEIEWVYGPVE